MTRTYQATMAHYFAFQLIPILVFFAVAVGLEEAADLPMERSILVLPYFMVLMYVFIGLILHDNPRMILVDGGEVTIISVNSLTNTGKRFRQAQIRGVMKSDSTFLLLHGKCRVAVVRRRELGDLEWEELAGYFGLEARGARPAEYIRRDTGHCTYKLGPRNIERQFRNGMLVAAAGLVVLWIAVGGDIVPFLLLAAKASGAVIAVISFRTRRDVYALEVTSHTVGIGRAFLPVPLLRRRRYWRDQLSVDATDARITIRYRGKIVGVVHAEATSMERFAEIKTLLTGQLIAAHAVERRASTTISA